MSIIKLFTNVTIIIQNYPHNSHLILFSVKIEQFV